MKKLILVTALCFMAYVSKAQFTYQPWANTTPFSYGDTLRLSNYTQLTLSVTWTGTPNSWKHTKLTCNGVEVQPNCTPNEYDIILTGYYHLRLKHNGVTYGTFKFFVKP